MGSAHEWHRPLCVIICMHLHTGTVVSTKGEEPHEASILVSGVMVSLDGVKYVCGGWKMCGCLQAPSLQHTILMTHYYTPIIIIIITCVYVNMQYIIYSI